LSGLNIIEWTKSCDNKNDYDFCGNNSKCDIYNDYEINYGINNTCNLAYNFSDILGIGCSFICEEIIEEIYITHEIVIGLLLLLFGLIVFYVLIVNFKKRD